MNNVDFKKLLDEAGLSDEQQETVVTNLSKAIAVGVADKLVSQLTEQRREDFFKLLTANPDDVEALKGFFLKHFSKEVIEENFSEVSKAVVTQYLSKIKV